MLSDGKPGGFVSCRSPPPIALLRFDRVCDFRIVHREARRRPYHHMDSQHDGERHRQGENCVSEDGHGRSEATIVPAQRITRKTTALGVEISLDTIVGHSCKETNMRPMGFARILMSIAALSTPALLCAAAHAKEYIKGDRPQQRGYSEAVITEGGKTVWLAGQIALVDDNGKSLAGDFEGQARQLFKNLDRTLQKAGGKLSDMVQMTVFITDVRYGDRLTEIRREVFGDNFPGSALITITALAVPEAKIEIQGYAVIGGK